MSPVCAPVLDPGGGPAAAAPWPPRRPDPERDWGRLKRSAVAWTGVYTGWASSDTAREDEAQTAPGGRRHPVLGVRPSRGAENVQLGAGAHPVPGWEAERTLIKTGGEDTRQLAPSYLVRACPLYEEG